MKWYCKEGALQSIDEPSSKPENKRLKQGKKVIMSEGDSKFSNTSMM